MKKILFFGDSITDGNRDYKDKKSLGNGYVKYIADKTDDVTIINRGINGERVRDLLIRLEQDVLDERPDIVTIFIGINDTWRKFEDGEETISELFHRDYSQLIGRIQAKGSRVILMSPYLLEIDEVFYTWREDLNPKIKIVEQLAKDYGCLFIPLDSIMQGYANLFGKKDLAYDGVHPSEKGIEIIASTWLTYLKNMDL
ncbi:MAG: SGNH/GDSL hydrolase family protein [Culicoidibacterales bacterium]